MDHMPFCHPFAEKLWATIPRFPSSQACFAVTSWQVLGHVHQKQSELHKSITVSAKSAYTRRHEYNIFIGGQATEM